MSKLSRWVRVGACLVVVTSVAAGCSSDDEGEADDPSPSSESSGSPGEAASGDPVRVGFHSVEGGAISLPEIRIGFEQGVRYVNEELGGIAGAPLEAVSCSTDGTPEKAVDCANQFVEEDVAASVQGIELAGAAMLPILEDAGIAEIGMASFTPEQHVDVGHSFFFGNAAPSTNLATLLAMQEQGAESVRIFLGDVPVGHEDFEEIIEPTAETLGMDVEAIFYPLSNPDWTSLVTSALEDEPDAIAFVAAPEPDCIGMMTAASQMQYEGITFLGTCTQYISVLGEAAEGSLTMADQYDLSVADQAPPEKAEAIQTYIDWMEDADEGDLTEGPTASLALAGFALAVDLAGALSQIDGDLDAAAVLEGMPTVSGERFIGNTYDCDGSAWPGHTGCSLGQLVYETNADGSRSLVSDGFLDLTEYVPSS